MHSLKLLIFVTAYPNPHYLPNLDMLPAAPRELQAAHAHAPYPLGTTND